MPNESEQRALEALIVSQLRGPEGEVDMNCLPELNDQERDTLDSFGENFVDDLLSGRIQPKGDDADNDRPEREQLVVAGEEVFGLNRAEEIDEETAEELEEQRKRIIDQVKRETEDGRSGQ